MGLNKVKGNMYSFCTHTWNAIKGKCSHDCSYCYMKRWGKQNPIRLDEKELKTDLGENNFIFVGSSCDMFEHNIPSEWIMKTLEHCRKYPKNTYLFQTKNPRRLIDFKLYYPKNTILGTTIETNREVGVTYSEAPPIIERINAMSKIEGFRKMVTIEPIFDFDVEDFIGSLQRIKPEFINIGADSTRNNLPEPNKDKIKELIDSLKCFTKVNLKDNLKRLYKK